jgi:hypothetical protein
LNVGDVCGKGAEGAIVVRPPARFVTALVTAIIHHSAFCIYLGISLLPDPLMLSSRKVLGMEELARKAGIAAELPP